MCPVSHPSNHKHSLTHLCYEFPVLKEQLLLSSQHSYYRICSHAAPVPRRFLAYYARSWSHDKPESCVSEIGAKRWKMLSANWKIQDVKLRRAFPYGAPLRRWLAFHIPWPTPLYRVCYGISMSTKKQNLSGESMRSHNQSRLLLTKSKYWR